MRTVVIGATGWTEGHPQRIRGDLVRMIYSLAASNGYDIVVARQRWRAAAAPTGPRRHVPAPALTDDRWAMLMGYRSTPLDVADLPTAVTPPGH